jgi:exodeoxyribonuclease VII small subunit
MATTGGSGRGPGGSELAPVEVGKLSYSSAAAELDGIIDEFETGVIDVDRLVDQLERATEIVDELDRRLRRTRLRVEELVPRLEAIGQHDLSVDEESDEASDEETEEGEPAAGGDEDSPAGLF